MGEMSVMSMEPNGTDLSLSTQFPPVTYSSSFVSYLIQAASETEISEEPNVPNGNTNLTANQTSKKSPQISAAKSRWKQLARSAFTRSLNNKTTNHTNHVNNCEAKHTNHNNHTNHTNGIINGVNTHINHNNHDNDVTNNKDNNCSIEDKELTLLELLALKSLELSAPASDVILKSRTNNWVQLSGHEGSFALAGPGTIWKKRSTDDTEVRAYEALMHDPMSEMVPKFFRDVKYKGDNFIEIEDLLYEFKDAAIMDIKMGTRTFLESEVQNTKARHDLYEKMMKIDPSAPTEQEHCDQAVTKLTYMKFREDLSSSSNLGFRIEGFKAGDDLQLCKDLKLVKQREEVKATLKAFLMGKDSVRLQLIDRLKDLVHRFEKSEFFRTHEVIGSSLLIIHNGKNAGVWMIDFAKTVPVPEGVNIDHKSQWRFGNHEDGYLLGLYNLISILQDCQPEQRTVINGSVRD